MGNNLQSIKNIGQPAFSIDIHFYIEYTTSNGVISNRQLGVISDYHATRQRGQNSAGMFHHDSGEIISEVGKGITLCTHILCKARITTTVVVESERSVSLTQFEKLLETQLLRLN